MSLLILLLTTALADEAESAVDEPESSSSDAPSEPAPEDAPAEDEPAEAPVPELTLEQVWAQQDPAELLAYRNEYQSAVLNGSRLRIPLSFYQETLAMGGPGGLCRRRRQRVNERGGGRALGRPALRLR